MIKDMTLNNRQWLICQKSKPKQTKPNQEVTSIIYQ